jgi:hypothetical protein
MIDQRAGEHGHRPCQRPLLGALALVAAVEDPVEKFKMLAEHVPVEPFCDLSDVLPDHRQGRRNDGLGPLGQCEHRSFLPPGIPDQA